MARNTPVPASVNDIRSRISSVPGQNFAWKDDVQAFSEEAIVLLDQSQDKIALRQRAELCRTRAVAIKGTGSRRPLPAVQIAADALVHLATHLEARAAELDAQTSTAKDGAAVTTPPLPPANDSTGENDMDDSQDPPKRDTLSGYKKPADTDPSSIEVDRDVMEISPLNRDELDDVETYLRKPIETWTFTDRSEVYFLCYSRMSGNPRRTGSSDELAKLYQDALELRLKQLKDLASPAITAYFLERHCQLAQNLLGISEPSRDPEGKVTDPDELQVHRRWAAYLISAKNGWLTRQDRDWIKKNTPYLPPSTRDVLENRMRKDAEPANAPGAKTTNLAAIAAATANPDPAPADSAPAGTTEPPPDGQTDALPASNKADVTDERPLTVPKKPIDPLMVAIFALIAVAIMVFAGRGVARLHWFSPSPAIATHETPPTPTPTLVVQPPPVPAVVQPAPAPAPVQPPAVVAQLRPLRASDVNVTDLRHVRDGQIPFSLRLEHMQCAVPPRRNPDNTVDFSACQWVEMRPVRR